MSEDLLKRIDEERLLEKFKPSRSAWIVAELSAAVENSKRLRGVARNFEVAGEIASAGAGGPSSSSTRTPASLPEPKGDTRLNEAPPTLAPKTISGPRTRSARGAIKKIIEREKGK